MIKTIVETTRLLTTLTIIVSFLVRGHDCKVVQFIFGDSLSDVGNNNYLAKSLARASLPWYGIDFGNGLPNGRFSNGRTVADIIGDNMGLPRPPAFLDPSLNEDLILENGVNYASGGGGILNETGSYFVQRFGLYKQIELFQGTQELIRGKIGESEAEKFFPGGEILHGLGARKLMVFGLGPMGCIPLQRVLSSSGGCQDRTNKLALSFNQAASQLVTELSSSLPNATFRFGDAYDVVNDIISNPNNYGFSNADSPCCSFGKIRPALTCIPASTLCKDRSKYVFWDEYHPSDRANELIASEMIKKLGFKPVNQTDSPPPAMAPSAS
ncbi:GDSL esterase/lipase [Sesamum angolense]|uniref:GDSL esterase/lipase n=1 Tax=Sesamum angolense TaxID=2727404 RepID=A0AAE1WZ80_9LAMI|nr:GDSL esterase/lipase [Sesamum angolense]